jgi:hypothetical protein
MTVKQAILKLSKKYRTYDQIGSEVKQINPASYETVARKLRELQAEGKVEGSTKRVKFSDGATKVFKVFRRV